MTGNPLATVLRRPPGEGWLVVSGASLADDLRLFVPELLEHAGTILICVPSKQSIPQATTILSSWQDSIGWQGRVISLANSDSEELEAAQTALSEASLIVFPAIESAEEYAMAISEFEWNDLLLAALEEGAVMVMEGAAAEVMGDFFQTSDGKFIPGMGWMPGIIIQSGFVPEMHCPLLNYRPRLLRIGLSDYSAIALGPADQRLIWGTGKPTLTFGIGWD